MLADLQNQLKNAMMLVNAIPTGLPTLPSLPTLPAVTLPTLPTLPTAPSLPDVTFPSVPSSLPFTIPSTLPKSINVQPAETNRYTGLQVGVDVNNKGGWNRDSQGRLVNNLNQLVDENGIVIDEVQTYVTYASANVGPQPTTRPIILAPGVAPGGGSGGDALTPDGDVDADALAASRAASSDAASGGLGIGAYVGIGVVGFLCVLLLCVLVFCVTSRKRDSVSSLEYNVNNAAYGPNGGAALQSNVFGAWNQPASQAGTFGNFGGAPAVAAPAAASGMATTAFPTATASTWSTATAFDLPNVRSGTMLSPASPGTGAIPQFACPHCDKRYHYESDVKSHVAARHDANGF